MNDFEILLVTAPGSNAYTWAETLEEILDIKINALQPRQVPILPLRGVYSLIVIDSTPDSTVPATSATLELCQRIRRRFDDPIILLIDTPREQSAVNAYAAEVDECIAKPISVALLAAKVRSWLRWSSDYVSMQGKESASTKNLKLPQNNSGQLIL